MSSKARKEAAKKSELIPTIKCKIGLGTFPGERMIVLELPDGDRLTGFADKRDVFVSQPIQPGEMVEGRVRVSVVERGKDSALVDLPQPFITKGPRVRVPLGFLEARRS